MASAAAFPLTGSPDMPVLLNRSQVSGFGMIEVMAAFILLSLSLGVLLGGMTVGLRNSDRAAQAGLALLHAESLMAQTGISAPLEEGETSGRMDGGYQWKRQISRTRQPGADFVRLVTVGISVTPPDGGAPVRLVSLRHADAPPAEGLRK